MSSAVMTIKPNTSWGSVATRSNIAENVTAPRQRNAFKVLFLCADNCICSVFAEALLKRWGGRDFQAFSAGILPPDQIHPLAIDLMKSYNLWDQGLRTRSCGEFLAQQSPAMDFVVTVGGRPPVGMPAAWPGNPQVIHWRITEPILDSTPKQQSQSLKTAFRELETRIKLFVLVYQREIKGIATAA